MTKSFLISVLISIKTSNNKVINNNNKDKGLKPNLFKFKKAKIIKSKFFPKLSKFQNANTNIRARKFLSLKTKIVFIQLKQIFNKIIIF